MIHLPQLSPKLSTRVAMSVSTQGNQRAVRRDQRGLRLTPGSRRRTGRKGVLRPFTEGYGGDHGAEGSHSGFFPLALGLPQHPDEHRPQRPILLAVDQQLGERLCFPGCPTDIEMPHHLAPRALR
jgi:hypothetical protein